MGRCKKVSRTPLPSPKLTCCQPCGRLSTHPGEPTPEVVAPPSVAIPLPPFPHPRQEPPPNPPAFHLFPWEGSAPRFLEGRVPRPAPYLLLDCAQQPLPGLRLCGTRQEGGWLAEGWGRTALPPQPRPAPSHPRGLKPWLVARLPKSLTAALLAAQPWAAAAVRRGREPSDVRSRHACGPAPPESRCWAEQVPPWSFSPPGAKRTALLLHLQRPHLPRPPPSRPMSHVPPSYVGQRSRAHHLFSVCQMPDSRKWPEMVAHCFLIFETGILWLPDGNEMRLKRDIV